MEWFNLGDSVNQLGLLGAVAILALTIFIVGGYIKKMKDSKAEGELTSEDWDGIKEFKMIFQLMGCYLSCIVDLGFVVLVCRLSSQYLFTNRRI